MSTSAWLDWMASLMGASRQSYAATFPPDRFYCLLDELPLHLIPRHRVARQIVESSESHNVGDHRLFLNPDCVFTSGEHWPEELSSRKDLLRGFALQGTVAWVKDPARDSLSPFWLGPRFEAAVRAIGGSSSSVPPDVRDVLVSAGILTSQNRLARLQAERPGAIEKSSASFREKGYATIADLIHPFHLAALRRYYRYLIRTGAIHLGDGQSPRRHVAYNESVARFFHHQIAKPLSALAGTSLKPSYVYMASYLEGAELKKHTDREQCEYSVTLCLDFSPEPVLETPWPIHLETSSGEVTVYQALGDGLAYRGTRVPHYRHVLGTAQTSTSIFFHYVAADFAGSLD